MLHAACTTLNRPAARDCGGPESTTRIQK